MRSHYVYPIIAWILLVPITSSAQQQAPQDVIERTQYITGECPGDDVFLRGEANTAESYYLWSRIENGVSTPLTYTSRTYTYIVGNQQDTIVCEVITSTTDAKNNLMASGDFEVCPPDFDSDYQYAFQWDLSKGCSFSSSDYYTIVKQKFGDHTTYQNNIYAITSNANTFWTDYQVKAPHGGNYFALFDAGKEGYAWKAETKKGNPNLKLQKDSTYLFSYWTAHPNTAGYSGSPADLQFVLILRQGTKTDTVDLGASHKLYQQGEKDNNWHYVEVRWRNSLYDCDDVTIGVYDKNQNAGNGNDFCLDDIMFQKTTTVTTTILYRTTFIIQPADCQQPKTCPTMIETTPQDTTVCFDTPFPLLWHGHTFTKPTPSGTTTLDTILKAQSDPTCDSIHLTYRVHLTAAPTTDSTAISLCDSELPYSWQWQTAPITVAGVYRYAEQSNIGCDSVYHVLSLYLSPSVQQYKKWQDVIFIPDPDSIYATYQWYHDGNAIDGATEQYYYDPNGLSGLYHCVMQRTNGTTEQSCDEDFNDIDRSADENPGQQPARQIVAQRMLYITPTLRVVLTTYSDDSVEATKQCIIRF